MGNSYIMGICGHEVFEDETIGTCPRCFEALEAKLNKIRHIAVNSAFSSNPLDAAADLEEIARLLDSDVEDQKPPVDEAFRRLAESAGGYIDSLTPEERAHVTGAPAAEDQSQTSPTMTLKDAPIQSGAVEGRKTYRCPGCSAEVPEGWTHQCVGSASAAAAVESSLSDVLEKAELWVLTCGFCGKPFTSGEKVGACPKCDPSVL